MNDEWLINRVAEIAKRGWRLDRRHIFQGSYDVFNSNEEQWMYRKLMEQRLSAAVTEGWLNTDKDKYGMVYVLSQKSKDYLDAQHK